MDKRQPTEEPYPDAFARARFQRDVKADRVKIFRTAACALCEDPVPKGFTYCSKACYDADTFAEQLAGEYHAEGQEED